MFSLISLALSSSRSFCVFSVYSLNCLRRAAQVSAGFSPGLLNDGWNLRKYAKYYLSNTLIDNLTNLTPVKFFLKNVYTKSAEFYSLIIL